MYNIVSFFYLNIHTKMYYYRYLLLRCQNDIFVLRFTPCVPVKKINDIGL